MPFPTALSPMSSICKAAGSGSRGGGCRMNRTSDLKDGHTIPRVFHMTLLWYRCRPYTHVERAAKIHRDVVTGIATGCLVIITILGIATVHHCRR